MSWSGSCILTISGTTWINSVMGKLITSLTKPFLWFVSLFLQILVRRRRDLAYAEHSQASKMELLPKIVIG